MSRLTLDGAAGPVQRDQILRRERGQGNTYFPCSADHVQDWQSYPVDPYSCYMCDHICIQAAVSYHLFFMDVGFRSIVDHSLAPKQQTLVVRLMINTRRRGLDHLP